MTEMLKSWSKASMEQKLIAGLGVLIVCCTMAALYLEEYAILGIPAVVLLAFVAIVDVKKIFWLLLFCIPISMEVPISTNLATDLPTEPLTVLMMGIGFLLLLKEGGRWKKDFLLHPISLLLILHVGWVIATTIVSDAFIFSLKFALAKIWYVATFYFITGYFIQNKKDFKKMLWVILIPLFIATLITMFRHSLHGFSFDKSSSVTWPFFRNHVSYAAILVIFIPFVYLCRNWFPKGSWTRRLLVGISLLFVVAIYFSYTRAAYLSLLIAMGAYFVFKYKLTRLTLVGLVTGLLLSGLYLYQNNNYMLMAPDFEKTVTHFEFDNLVAATAKGEDISTMERVYRWVAGVFLIKDHPWMGVGPGNFYNFYRSYSLNAFATYVSNNPDRSGIHCYYLLMGVEQGIPGMLIFLALVFLVLIYGERIYHQSRDPEIKNFVMALLLCLIAIYALLIINDMIETDKVGSLFFICIAILVNVDIMNKKNSIGKTNN